MSTAPPLNFLDAADLGANPEPRCPCVLLLDTSGSMEGAPMAALLQGLQSFKKDLSKDNLAARRVEVAVITFDDTVNVVQTFITVDLFEPPILTAGGHTAMAQGILTALDLIQKRKAQYKASGVTYYRPWIFMITDGEPDPASEGEAIIREAAERLKADEKDKKVFFCAVAVENANLERLGQLSIQAPVKLVGLNFQKIFSCLSTSMEAVVQGKMDDQLPLPAPDWGT